MINEKLDIIALGEGLIELSCEVSLSESSNFHKYYGGDSLAAAISARRLGSKVGFITKVGNDYFKDYDKWKEVLEKYLKEQFLLTMHGYDYNDAYNRFSALFDEKNAKVDKDYLEHLKRLDNIVNENNAIEKEGTFEDDEFVEGKDFNTTINKIKSFFGSVKSKTTHAFNPLINYLGIKCKKCDHLLKSHEELTEGCLICNECPKNDNLCKSK